MTIFVKEDVLAGKRSPRQMVRSAPGTVLRLPGMGSGIMTIPKEVACGVRLRSEMISPISGLNKINAIRS